MGKKTVLVGMSGGVDSAVTSLRLMRAGYEVTGVTFTMTEAHGEIDSLPAVSDAREVCALLGIRHITADLRAEFAAGVVAPFIEEYRCGRTPNPCVLCNRVMKFAHLARIADAEGIAHVATGHYAKAVRLGGDEAPPQPRADGILPALPQAGRHCIAMAESRKKDQSYVLYSLPQELLSRLLLPLGEATKEQVRAEAQQFGLQVSSKPDSQDICFIPDGDYAAFLAAHSGTPAQVGNFVDEAGKILGPHRGIWHYTVGQRRGLGLPMGERVFVHSIDAASGNVVVGGESGVFSRRILAHSPYWMGMAAPQGPVGVTAKIRYAHRGADAVLSVLQNGDIELVFDEPQRAPTPGQAAVFYCGEYVLGGGTIYRCD